jgi:hypothetical protein
MTMRKMPTPIPMQLLLLLLASLFPSGVGVGVGVWEGLLVWNWGLESAPRMALVVGVCIVRR